MIKNTFDGQNKKASRLNDKFRNLCEQSPNMVFINKGGRIIYVNHKCEDVMGYTRDYYYSPGFHFEDLVAPEDVAPVKADIERLLRDEQVLPRDCTLIPKNGQRINVIVSTKLVDYEGSQAILGIVTDITAHKQLEDELRANGENLRRSMDANPLGIRICNSEWETVYANRTLLDIYGFESIKEFNSMPDEKIYKPESYFEHMARVEQTKQGERIPIKHEISIVRKDGEIRHLEVIYRDIFWNHRPQHQLFYRDITDIKQMQDQLIRQDRLVSLGQLVSGVAHEVNNPLTSIIGYSELLLHKKELPDGIKAYLKIVESEAKRIASIVQNLLTFAQQGPEVKTLLDVNEIIQAILAMRNYEQKIRNIQVKTRLHSGLPPVDGNFSRLEQVFFNVITNAEQAMLEAHNKGTLTITTEWKGVFVRASFADDGPGISKEHMARLFSPFFTTKEIGEGTGLGLSISQGIIVEHGGRIWAESKPGGGATFIVELPVYKQSPRHNNTNC